MVLRLPKRKKPSRPPAQRATQRQNPHRQNSKVVPPEPANSEEEDTEESEAKQEQAEEEEEEDDELDNDEDEESGDSEKVDDDVYDDEEEQDREHVAPAAAAARPRTSESKFKAQDSALSALLKDAIDVASAKARVEAKRRRRSWGAPRRRTTRKTSTDVAVVSPTVARLSQMASSEPQTDVVALPKQRSAGSSCFAAERAQNRRNRSQQLAKRLHQLVGRSSFTGESAISSDFYSSGQVMGQGAYGKVLAVTHNLTNTKVALKSYEKSRFRNNPDLTKMLENEMAIVDTLNHPHIIRHYESFENLQRVSSVMEFASGGSLYGKVKREQRLDEDQFRPIARQLVQAVAYLHRQGLVHRDIKMENVLFDEHGNVKLADFGFCTYVRGAVLKEYVGTPVYMAPEVVLKRRYGLSVDVWSLGVLFYVSLCGSYPFGASHGQANDFMFRRRMSQGMTPMPPNASPLVQDLLTRMLSVSVEDRLTIEQVWQHPWFADTAQGFEGRVRDAPRNSMPITTDLSEGSHAAISEDPNEDLRDSVLERVVRMGFVRRRMVHAVVSKARNQFTTTYYILLKKARLNARKYHENR